MIECCMGYVLFENLRHELSLFEVPPSFQFIPIIRPHFSTIILPVTAFSEYPTAPHHSCSVTGTLFHLLSSVTIIAILYCPCLHVLVRVVLCRWRRHADRVVNEREPPARIPVRSPTIRLVSPLTFRYHWLISFIRSHYCKRGYDEIITPNIYKLDLWHQLGTPCTTRMPCFALT
jgi:hypothetical protein